MRTSNALVVAVAIVVVPGAALGQLAPRAKCIQVLVVDKGVDKPAPDVTITNRDGFSGLEKSCSPGCSNTTDNEGHACVKVQNDRPGTLFEFFITSDKYVPADWENSLKISDGLRTTLLVVSKDDLIRKLREVLEKEKADQLPHFNLGRRVPSKSVRR